MTVPYIFAYSTGDVPLNELDANFASVANNVSTANTAVFVTGNSQANITSVGTLTTLSVTGNTTANLFVGNLVGYADTAGNAVFATSAGTANNAGSSAFANVANSAIIAGTVTSAGQANITSVGTLTSLSSSGNIAGNNVSAITAIQLPVYANVSARNSAISQPTVGMLVVVGNTYQGYNGVTWGNITLS